jgi:hypothetical protein
MGLPSSNEAETSTAGKEPEAAGASSANGRPDGDIKLSARDSLEVVISADEPDGPHLEPLTDKELLLRRELWRSVHSNEPREDFDYWRAIVESWTDDPVESEADERAMSS